MKISFNIATIAFTLVSSSALEATKEDLMKRLKKHRSLSMPDGIETFLDKLEFMDASASFFDPWEVEFPSSAADLGNSNFGFSGPNPLFFIDDDDDMFTYPDVEARDRIALYTGSDLYFGLGEDQIGVSCDFTDTTMLSEYCQCVFDNQPSNRKLQIFSECELPFPDAVIDALKDNEIVNVFGEGIKAQISLRNNILPILSLLLGGVGPFFNRRLQQNGFFGELTDIEITTLQQISECNDGCVHTGMNFLDSQPATDSQGPLAVGFDLEGQTEDLHILALFDGYDEFGVYTVPAGTNGFVGIVSTQDLPIELLLFATNEGKEMTFTIDNIVGVNQATPSASPSEMPSAFPSESPSEMPSTSTMPSASPSMSPSSMPSKDPSASPSSDPSSSPSMMPSTSSMPSSAPAVEEDDDDDVSCGLGDIPIIGDILCVLPCF